MASTQRLAVKQEEVAALEKIFSCNGVYLFDYRGLKVSEFESLRRKVRDLNAHLRVIKNRLAIKYFEKSQLPFGREIFSGPMAVVYADDKYVEAAKVLVDFEKESKKIKIKKGFIERKLVDEQTISEVSKLPSKEQLLATLVMSISAPLRKFGYALSSPLSTMLILLKNLKTKKEKGG